MRKNQIKKVIAILLCMFCVGMAIPMQADAANILTINTSYSNGTISFSGTTDNSVVAAVVVLCDSTGAIVLAMQSVPVNSASYSGSFTSQNLPSGTYQVKVADYNGGAYNTDTFTVSTPPGSSNTQNNNSNSGNGQTTVTTAVTPSPAPTLETPVEPPTEDNAEQLDDVPATGEVVNYVFVLTALVSAGFFLYTRRKQY